jgi:hypothetical protein
MRFSVVKADKPLRPAGVPGRQACQAGCVWSEATDSRGDPLGAGLRRWFGEPVKSPAMHLLEGLACGLPVAETMSMDEEYEVFAVLKGPKVRLAAGQGFFQQGCPLDLTLALIFEGLTQKRSSQPSGGGRGLHWRGIIRREGVHRRHGRINGGARGVTR